MYSFGRLYVSFLHEPLVPLAGLRMTSAGPTCCYPSSLEPYSKFWYIQENNDTPKTVCNIFNQPTDQPPSDSSHSSPSTKETVNFMNFSSVTPSTGSSEPSWTLPAWISSSGCSPSGRSYCSVGPLYGHKSWQQTWSSVGSSLHGFINHAQSLLLSTWSSHRIAAIFGHLPDPIRGPSWAADESLLHHKPLWTVSRQPASSWSSSGADLKKLMIWGDSWGLEKGKY